MANYNYIAPYYDTLCGLMFGQKVKEAQIDSFSYIPVNSNILIVGGGTGWILDELKNIHPTGLNVTYIDCSQKMIQLSKKRNFTPNHVKFVAEFIENTDLFDQKFDVIITPFLFSNHSQTSTRIILNKLDKSLIRNGIWLNIDFHISDNSKFRHILLLKLMYLSFRVTCGIEANELPSIVDFFSSYKSIRRKTSCNSFIKTDVFLKDTITNRPN